MSRYQNSIRNNRGHRVLFGILCLLAISIYTSSDRYNIVAQQRVFTPQIPDVDRYQKNKVFLEYADKLSMDEAISPEYQVLTGNVKFRKEGMFMYCDSAHFYESSNSLDAFGNVRMEQGDTLFAYADVLYYNGDEELARLRYNVRLENRDVNLYTDSLDYDMVQNLGYYMAGGKIIDSENELSSVYGQYSPDTKDSEFLFDVKLINDNFILETDTLKYNTDTHIADIVGPTNINTNDSTLIISDLGWYNTESEKATLYNRSTIYTNDGKVLVGDTLVYDKKAGFGETFGNMVLTDTVNSSILEGDYGYYNELNETSFATGHARALEYSQGDTLYLHGDTIRTYIDQIDTTRVMTSYKNTRFFRTDIQGICDSASFTSRDTLLHMHIHPIVWNENKQIFGNIIEIHLNDSTVDWARLPEFAFLAEQIESIYYNQLSGNELLAIFDKGELSQVDVSGNVTNILFPAENDSTYNKMVYTESSFLTILFKGKQIEKLKMWPEISGKVTPLFMSKRADCYLKDFAWYDKLRPINKDDIFNIPPEMKSLMGEPEKKSGRSKRVSGIALKPNPVVNQQPSDSTDIINNNTPTPPDSIVNPQRNSNNEL